MQFQPLPKATPVILPLPTDPNTTLPISWPPELNHIPATARCKAIDGWWEAWEKKQITQFKEAIVTEQSIEKLPFIKDQKGAFAFIWEVDRQVALGRLREIVQKYKASTEDLTSRLKVRLRAPTFFSSDSSLELT
jgi:hypothetical protein